MNRWLVYALGVATGEVLVLLTLFVLPVVHRDAGHKVWE